MGIGSQEEQYLHVQTDGNLEVSIINAMTRPYTRTLEVTRFSSLQL